MANEKFEDGFFIEKDGTRRPAMITGYGLDGKIALGYTGPRLTAQAGIWTLGTDAPTGNQSRVEIKDVKAIETGKKNTDGTPQLRPVYDIVANVGSSKMGIVKRFVQNICEAKYLFSGVDSGLKHSFEPTIVAPEAKKPEPKK